MQYHRKGTFTFATYKNDKYVKHKYIVYVYYTYLFASFINILNIVWRLNLLQHVAIQIIVVSLSVRQHTLIVVKMRLHSTLLCKYIVLFRLNNS